MNAQNFPPIPFLDLKAQQARLGQGLKDRLEAVLAHGQYILGPEVLELEAKLAAFCGAAHCVSVSSGTDALQIALMAEGIGRGDAVFLPAFTYTATAEVPLLLGATPVFVDVDPRTFQIDLNNLRERIETVKHAGKLKPRAVIGVDLFGQPADWLGIRATAVEYGLFTLDDCAQSFGAAQNGERLGKAADATATSFFPSKPLGAYGDGGALFTESAERAALYRSLRSHGEGNTRYEVLRTGMNGRLDSMQAAVLLAKLEVFEGEIARREEIARIYDAALKDVLEIPVRMQGGQSAWAVYSVLLPDEATRDAAKAALAAASIGHAVYYPRALHQQPAYQAAHDGATLPVAESLGGRILALPIHPDLTDEQAGRVAATLRQALER
ncbi:MAG: DegT/DnrJ/EryC1/StrS aminotransferase family protein [Proteobacteria bacterium]|nr:DegT/DnrJ/EryC1/StrS aminotransferase family protein [Pseudomonadota bacterium]MBU6425016.1 DegT/DnrJ/EryC1/StrS aminotransferase family protein [Rhodospirillales bacterium]